jgi:hypothetical protein
MELFHAVAIVSIQAALGGEPDETLGVLVHVENGGLGQIVPGTDLSEVQGRARCR